MYKGAERLVATAGVTELFSRAWGALARLYFRELSPTPRTLRISGLRPIPTLNLCGELLVPKNIHRWRAALREFF